MEFELTAEAIQSNYKTLFKRIDQIFPTRAESLKVLYNDLGEERLMFAPASGTDYFHNAIPGGYLDHVLRVMNFSVLVYRQWTDMGLKVDDFSLEELMFSALNHDLGKMGYVGLNKEGYVLNESKWHRENQGKIYNGNENIPFCTIQTRSLFLLQQYCIPLSWNEYLGIHIHDGLYDDANKPYYMGYSLKGKLRSNLPKILHQADIMAAQFEFERWNTITGKLNTDPIETSKIKVQTPAVKKYSAGKSDIGKNLAKEFHDLFKTEEI